jgi:4-hydroxybenzoate polyprenyltransferase
MHLRTLNKLVLWEQTLFGLPWIATSIALAPPLTTHLSLGVVVWILCAFISARVAGMAFNRLIDQEIDGQNPRTRNRVLPSGEASASQVRVVGLLAVALFVISCGMINPLCLMLSPIPLALLLVYSYTKRFTPLCHFVLGAIHCFSPIFAWIAVCDSLSLVPVCLGAAVMLSIAGSDVVYAMLDVEFDKNYRLYSIPLLLGTKKALRVAKGLHATAIALLVVVGLLAQAQALYFMGVSMAAGMYMLCYSELKPDIPERLNAFLTTCNRRVAMIIMIFTVSAGVWQRWL